MTPDNLNNQWHSKETESLIVIDLASQNDQLVDIMSEESSTSLQLIVDNQIDQKYLFETNLIKWVKEQLNLLGNIQNLSFELMKEDDIEVGVIISNNSSSPGFIEETVLFRVTELTLYNKKCIWLQIHEIDSHIQLRTKAIWILQSLMTNFIQKFIKHWIDSFPQIRTFLWVPNPNLIIDINSIKGQFNNTFFYWKNGLLKYIDSLKSN